MHCYFLKAVVANLPKRGALNRDWYYSKTYLEDIIGMQFYVNKYQPY